jgi:hypothetical protein
MDYLEYSLGASTRKISFVVLAADGYNCTWTVKINSPDINYED